MATLNILLYHGVTSARSKGIENFSGKHVLAKEFKRQMEYLAKHQNVVSLREGVRLLNKERSDEKDYVCVTFDDTYQNMYTDAFPILKESQVPATFFISTGFINTKKMFWTDKVENILNKSEVGSYELVTEKYSDNIVITKEKESQDKIDAIRRFKKYVKAFCTPKQRDELIRDLANCMNVLNYDSTDDVDNYTNLSDSQIREISDNDLFDVGGHSVNHEILSFLGEEELKSEIEESIKTLEDITLKKVDLYSYPEGQENHYNDKVIEILKSNGIKICPSAIHGINTGKTSSFHLKRVMVGFEGIEFPYEL